MFPRKETVERLRQEYPVGCRVELIEMNDPYNQKLKPGCRGSVTHIDDAATIHVAWDCGSSLGVAFNEDRCRRIDEND